MRTFFALELPAEVSMQVADWRDRQMGLVGRPIPPANFHITLAFIGELANDSLERLCLAVDAWLPLADIHGSQLQLDRTGYWPRPGIYWLGPSAWPESLSQLAIKLRHLATGSGAKRDRNPFAPHISLFRNCSTPPPAPLGIPTVTLPYRHFSLFESRQGKTGVSYRPLQHWALSCAAD